MDFEVVWLLTRRLAFLSRRKPANVFLLLLSLFFFFSSFLFFDVLTGNSCIARIETLKDFAFRVGKLFPLWWCSSLQRLPAEICAPFFFCLFYATMILSRVPRVSRFRVVLLSLCIHFSLSLSVSLVSLPFRVFQFHL